MSDSTEAASEAIAAVVFAWLKNSAGEDGKVEILNGEVGAAAEKLTAYLIDELGDLVRGWPITIEGADDARISIVIE